MTTARLAPPPVTGPARRGHRAAFSLTPRAFWLLAAGLLFVAPAWIDRRALILLVLWDAVVVALAFVNLQRLPRPERLHVTRRWSAPLAIGSPADVTIEIDNSGAVPIGVGLSDYVAGSMRRDLPELDLRVAPGGRADASYLVEPRERGDQAIGAVALQWHDAWGLVERWGIAALDQVVRVYPNLHEGRAQTLYLIRSRQTAIEKRRAKHFGMGREFDRLREYRAGDEQRDVSWSASARRGKLVTRVYQPERSQTVWLLVDAGRLLRARVGRETVLDATVTAALTLAQVALASGDRVALVAYGRRLQHRVAPARGSHHLRSLVEALATVRADAVEADHAGAAASVMAAQRRRALVVWLTDVAETAGVPDVIEQSARMSQSHVVLFAVPRQPEITALAAAQPGSAAEMYRVMSAQETLDRRETLLHGLRQRGALVLEVSPSELSAGVVDRYLEVKERGLL